MKFTGTWSRSRIAPLPTPPTGTEAHANFPLGDVSRCRPPCSPFTLAQHTLEAPQATLIREVRFAAGSGPEIPSGDVLLRDGVIEAVGKDLSIPPGARVIEGQELVAHPAFIDMATALGFEVSDEGEATGAPDEGVGASSASPFSYRRGVAPDRRALDHVRLTRENVLAHRRAGFGLAHIVPTDGLLRGQTALMTLCGQEAHLCALRFKAFQAAALRMGRGGYPSTLMGGMAHLRQQFLDARWFARSLERSEFQLPSGKRLAAGRVPRDTVLEALQPVLEGKTRLFVDADQEADIWRVLSFADEFSLTPLIVGASEAHLVASELKRRGVAVVSSLSIGDEPKREGDDETMPLPVHEERHAKWLARVRVLQVLADAGVPATVACGESPKDALAVLRTMAKHGVPGDVLLSAIDKRASEASRYRGLLWFDRTWQECQLVPLDGRLHGGEGRGAFQFRRRFLARDTGEEEEGQEE